MIFAIHYKVIAKLHRNRELGDSKLIELFETFYAENPIEARENAFRFYQNYIDVLVYATGNTYRSDCQARELLTSFIDPAAIAIDKHDQIGSLGFGIGVFFVVDLPIHDSDQEGDIYMIHGIGTLMEGSDSQEVLMLGLEKEYDYYRELGYSTNYNDTSVVFCDSDEWKEGYRDDEPSTYTILKTPFDWTGMDEPYWWVEPSNR